MKRPVCLDKKKFRFVLALLLVLDSTVVRADQINLAEDDASQEAYQSGFESGKNGGCRFGPWTMATDGNNASRHSGFFIATTEHNKDLTGIAPNDKAWGLYANGTGFEQAVAFHGLTTPLAAGDSFSCLLETGPFEKKSEADQTAGSSGLRLRTSNASEAPADYDKDAVFEFGHYDGQPNYQVRDGSGAEKADTGVIVTVTGADTYDSEIQNMSDKKLTKLPGRKLRAAGTIGSLAIFNCNSEKNDVFFNSLQVARESIAR